MQMLNDSVSAPLRFVLADGTTIGQFYNSWDQRYHFATYIPCRQQPREYLCGERGHFSPSREEHVANKRCATCVALLENMERSQHEH